MKTIKVKRHKRHYDKLITETPKLVTGHTITLKKNSFGFKKGTKAKVIKTSGKGSFGIIKLPNGMKAFAVSGFHT